MFRSPLPWFRVLCFAKDSERFKTSHDETYLHHLCTVLGPLIQAFGRAMNDFVEVGFPAVRSAQEYTRLNLRDMSTIATFFSAVTTGMIQIAIPTTGSSLDTVASLFFISWLVFSIAVIVQSLLSLAWNHSF